ncbi:MAG: hypothetical protein H6573_04720 [Lewinellaceae bacterium]|nr:hypothetical protein [Phaeodactylibacter sp.]MCB0611781.1 hypothetical protein [Phaeodactylibacter sp.]MCB9346802.1 hypothetical protein [Lewinellaceae bacterium]
MTQNYNSHLEALNEIRSLMERSSRFISLSGLSGVAAGLWALIGAAAAYLYLGASPLDGKHLYYQQPIPIEKWGLDYLSFFLLDATLVLILALSSGIFFTTRKARQKGQLVWGPLTQRLLLNLALPLVAGGIFCLGLAYHGLMGLIAPTTLVFYGLALINTSKYTLNDIRYLGITEVALGLMALFLPGYGLEFWCIGFGLLHIIYGLILYFKYERTA